MRENEFFKIYNNIIIELDLIYPVLTLNEINKLFNNYGIRVDNEIIEIVNKEILDVIKKNKSNTDIMSISKLISLLQMRQLFYDGNKRTSLIFFKVLMQELVPNFNYVPTTDNSEFNKFFNIYYCDSDTTSQKCIENISKYIIKD